MIEMRWNSSLPISAVTLRKSRANATYFDRLFEGLLVRDIMKMMVPVVLSRIWERERFRLRAVVVLIACNERPQYFISNSL